MFLCFFFKPHYGQIPNPFKESMEIFSDYTINKFTDFISTHWCFLWNFLSLTVGVEEITLIRTSRG